MSLMAILSYIAIALVSIYLGNKIGNLPFLCKKQIPSYVYWIGTGAIILTLSEMHSILFGYVIYLFLLFVLYDVVLLVVRKINKTAFEWIERCSLNGLLIFFLSVLVAVYGYYNSFDTKVTDYTVTIAKSQNGLENLKIVMISDTHMGTAIKKEELDQLVNTINSMDADIICLGGDIIDENTPKELITYTYQACGRLRSKYGTFFIIGNHELYMEQNYLQIAKGFERYGVKALLDETYLVEDKFYVAGRLDYDLVREGGTRKSVDQILEGIDRSLPVIMLDHQPEEYEEAKNAGVDLLLSGHTHNGQLYPGNYIILLGNEYGYGYREDGTLNTIVSSGVGTWGFAMRVGSRSEIVQVFLQIADNSSTK